MMLIFSHFISLIEYPLKCFYLLKGKLSHWLQKAVGEIDKVEYFLVDRQHHRNKVWQLSRFSGSDKIRNIEDENA